MSRRPLTFFRAKPFFTVLLFVTNVILLGIILLPKIETGISPLVPVQADARIEVPDAVAASGSGSTAAEKARMYSMFLEWKLEAVQPDGIYEVEQYREYEVYKNESGAVVKSIPTENYQYLRYLSQSWSEGK